MGQEQVQTSQGEQAADAGPWSESAAWLAARAEKVFVIEASAGGAVAASMTAAPGASAWFAGAAVPYTDTLKLRFFSVVAETIEAHGAVSEEVVAALLRGAPSDVWVLAESGIYGPGGDRPGKAVGTVCIGLRSPAGKIATRRLALSGDRASLRSQVCTQLAQLLSQQAEILGA